MLTENDNIDQLFRSALGAYEKAPPASVWDNIEDQLDSMKRIRRIKILKSMGIAATVLIALVTGWWMTNPGESTLTRQNSISEQKVSNTNINLPSTKKTPEITIAGIGKGDSDSSGHTVAVNPKSPSKVSSLATFAANTSFINNDGQLTPKKSSGERVLTDSEKEALDKLQQNFKIVKKITDWISDKVSNDTIRKPSPDSKSTILKTLTQIISDRTIASAFVNPVKTNSGKWSLKAEFAPVFYSQRPNKGQLSNLNYTGSQSYSPQRTTSENTVSAGIMAGYKVRKRMIVKTGIVYNKIRQTSLNVVFAGTNSFYKSPGVAMFATTPTGEVVLNKIANNNMATAINSYYQLDNVSLPSGDNALRQNIEFIEIPLLATYKLNDKKVAVGLTGGLSTSIKVGNSAVLNWNGEKISSGETSNVRNMVYSGIVGIELGYEISNRVSIYVEPRLKHYINSLSMNKSVNYRPSQMEIATGLTYCFN